MRKRILQALDSDDPACRNEVAAKILSLYAIGGRGLDEILKLTIRLHRDGYAPGGRRSDKPPVPRIRTERQRRNLKANVSPR